MLTQEVVRGNTPNALFRAAGGCDAGHCPGQQASGGFTAGQVQSGSAFYERNCAACHGMDLEGSGDAPPLAGGTFMLKWGPKMVSELVGTILETMPPAGPESLDEGAVLNATAYILQRNGAQAGHAALTAGATTRIDAIATGRAPSVVCRAGAGPAASAASASRACEELCLFLTPEMLKNPPAGDWLIFGCNYQRQLQPPQPDHPRQRKEPGRQNNRAWVCTIGTAS